MTDITGVRAKTRVTDVTEASARHAVFHSVINHTGATRYLLIQVRPTLGSHHLVLWWPEMSICKAINDQDVVEREAPAAVHYLRNSRHNGFLSQSRLVIFALQIIYLIAHRKQLEEVTINTLSNLGAIIGSFFLSTETKLTVYVHERPIGKWYLPIAVLRRLKRVHVITVSPFNKAELAAAGLSARWKYPAAFSENLTFGAYDADAPDRSVPSPVETPDPIPDILFVAHPDASKGFSFLCDLLVALGSQWRVSLYLSRAPATALAFPENVTVNIGQQLAPQHYRARVTVITSDPIGIKETFSYITAESLAAGTPVLCFPSGGISEQLIHGVNAHFVEDYSVAAFKAALDDLFAHPTRLERLRAGVLAVNEHKSAYLR